MQNDIRKELVLNSVLSFTKKCLENAQKTIQIRKMLIGHYTEKEIKEAYNLAKSLLRKEDRPKRQMVNYQCEVSLKLHNICKQVIAMVKTIRNRPHIILSSYDLNVPLQYAGDTANVARNNNKSTSFHSETAASDLSEIISRSFKDLHINDSSQVNAGDIVNVVRNINKSTSFHSEAAASDSSEKIVRHFKALQINDSSQLNGTSVCKANAKSDIFSLDSLSVIHCSENEPSKENASENLIKFDDFNENSANPGVINFNENTNYMNNTNLSIVDCALTCKSVNNVPFPLDICVNKISNDNTNVVNKLTPSAKCACKCKSAGNVDPHSEQLSQNSSVIIETLNSMLTELKVISNYSSHLSTISENVNKLLSLKNMNEINQKQSIDKSWNWTDLEKIWLTQSNPIMQNSNMSPEHSTPIDLEKVKVNLRDVFDGLPTQTLEQDQPASLICFADSPIKISSDNSQPPPTFTLPPTHITTQPPPLAPTSSPNATQPTPLAPNTPPTATQLSPLAPIPSPIHPQQMSPTTTHSLPLTHTPYLTHTQSLIHATAKPTPLAHTSPPALSKPLSPATSQPTPLAPTFSPSHSQPLQSTTAQRPPLVPTSLPAHSQQLSPVTTQPPTPVPTTPPPPPANWLKTKETEISPENMPLNLVLKNKPQDRINFSRPQQSSKGKKSSLGFVKKSKVKKPTVTEKEQDKTYESHPNLSRYKKQGKKNSREYSNIVSESEWEHDNTSLSDFEHVRDHPIQFAPDPSKRFTQEDNVPKKVTNPQRVWEREHYVPSVNYTSQQFNNWPSGSREAGEHYYRPNGTGYVRSQPSTALTSSNGPSTSNVQKVVKKHSYQITSVGNDGEEVYEEHTVNEDGVQVLHKTDYKSKTNRQRQEEIKGEDDLKSMIRNIATRILLTKTDPTMTEEL